MSDPDCIFCKIIVGEVPSYRVYEDDDVLAFLDIHPVSAGHTLVIPKHHSHNIFDIEERDWLAVSKSVRELSLVLEKGLGADGMNIRMNNREHGDQDVFHPHVHLIPRFKGDGLNMKAPQRSYKEGEADETLAKIKSVLS